MKTREQHRTEMNAIEDAYFEEWRRTGERPAWDYEDKQNEIIKAYNHDMEAGDHAHICHWSDVSPVTIIKKTATTLTVRYDKATKDETWKPEWVIGGFSAICTNIEDQKWNIEEDENGRTEIFRWSEKFGCYKNRSGEKLLPHWDKYYDYNF